MYSGNPRALTKLFNLRQLSWFWKPTKTFVNGCGWIKTLKRNSKPVTNQLKCQPWYIHYPYIHPFSYYPLTIYRVRSIHREKDHYHKIMPFQSLSLRFNLATFLLLPYLFSLYTRVKHLISFENFFKVILTLSYQIINTIFWFWSKPKCGSDFPPS